MRLLAVNMVLMETIMRGKLVLFLSAVCLIAVWSAPPVSADTIQISASADNTLYENATGSLSNGAGVHLFVGNTDQGSSGDGRRALISFDIAGAISAGSTITGVTLTLNASRVADNTSVAISLHTVAQAWGEGTSDAFGQEGPGTASTTGDATWIHTFFNTSTWTTPGGDFTAGASATTNVTGTGSYAWASVQMVADVQGWLDAAATNFGWLILANETINPGAKRFDSREHTTASLRPVLEVTFTPSAIPEPASMLLLGFGLSGLATLHRRLST